MRTLLILAVVASNMSVNVRCLAETTIVTFGDSTTAPRGGTVTYSEVLAKALEPKKVTIVNAGVGGNTTAMGKARFAKDVLSHTPTIAVIQFGINDSMVDVSGKPPRDKPRLALEDYVANLKYFISELRKQKATVILMTPNPLRWRPVLKDLYGKAPYDPDSAEGLNASIIHYADAVRKIAKDEKVELIDVFEAFQKSKDLDAILPDGMHPNTKGHQIVADLLLKKITSLLPAK